MTHDKGSEMKASDKDGMSIDSGRKPARSAPWRSRMVTGLLTAAVVAAFGGPFNSFAQQAQPVAGSNVRVDQAGNGVPVVQIAAPNAAGVSHNQYSNYNVEAQGQILNNSQEMVKTQLGGYILGNTNLQSGQSARIILNEVTSANPSHLKGYIEVAGKSAEVIVANPNGITCAGCGFINTTRNTLTTGTPIFGGDGSLSAFQVTRGLITVDGSGLNSGDRVDLIARAVQLNAGLWAKEANVVTGANRVGYADLSAQAIAGEGATPGYGLDVAAIGGMYAQKIRLVGTEAGVGVRSAGEFVATGGDFVLTSAGDVQLSGRTAAAGKVQVDAAGKAALTGRNYAEGDLSVSGNDVALGGDTWARNSLQASSRGAIDVSGTAQAADVRLDAAGNISLSGQVQSAQDMSLRAGATLNNAAQVVAGRDLRLSAAELAVARNAQVAAQGRLDAQVRNRIDNGGRLIGASGLNVAAGNLDNSGQIYGRDAALKVGGTLRNQSAIAAGETLKIEAGTFEQTATGETSARAIELAAGDRIDNAGRIRADTTLNLRGGRVDNSGIVYAATGAEIAADGALNNAGTLASDGALSLRSQALSNAKGATISSGDNLNLQAQQAADNAGQLYAKRNLNLSAGSLDNRGTLYGGQNAALASTDALRNSGSLVAGSGLIVQAGSLDSSGEIGSETGDIALDIRGDLSSTGKTLAPGRLSAKAGGALNVAGQTFGGNGVELESRAQLRSAGTIDSNGDIALRSGAGLDNDARIVTRGAVELKAATALNNAADIQAARIKAEAQRVDNRGRLLANGGIQVHGAQSLSNSGTLAAGLTADGGIGADGAVVLSSDGSLTQSGNVLAGRSIDLRANTLTLNGGKINSGGDANLSAAGDIDNTAGALTARNSLSLQTQGTLRNVRGQLDAARLRIGAVALDNSQGTIVQSGTDPFALNLAGALNNAGGRIAVNASTLEIAASDIDNADGRIEHAGIGGATVRANGAIANANGLIVANGALGLEAGGALSNARGQISGVGAGTVSAQSIDNNAGTIASDGGLRVSARQAIANQGGGIVQRGAGSLELRAAQLDNRGGGLVGAAGNGGIAIAGELDNRGGKLFAQNGLTLSADGALRNADGGAIQSGAALNLSAAGALDNTRGQIDANGATAIRAGALSNASGRLVSDSADALDVAVSGDIDNRGGTLGNSRGDTTLRGGGLDNGQGGRLIAGRDLSLSGNRFGNAGGLAYAERDLFYRNAGTSVDNAGGEIGAGRGVAIDAGTLNNNSGRIVAAQLELALSRLDNEAGDVSGSQRLNAVVGALAGNSGRLFGHERAAIRLFGDYTHTGGQRFESNGVLALSVDGTLINQATLQSAGELQVNAAAVVNTAGGKFNSSRADDTGLTRISAGRIDNAGRIEGDGVALTAADVNNTGTVIGSRVRIDADRLINGRDLGDAIPAASYNEGFIGATERTELRVAERLDNLDGELYSLGDLVIAGRADGSRAGVVRNRSGRISAERDLAIAANRISNERRVFETRWRELSADEQALNTNNEDPLTRYRHDDPDPTHQPPNVDPTQVVQAGEIAKANVTCRANDNGDNLRCIGFRGGSGDAKSFRSTTSNKLLALSEIARTSAESQIKAGRDIQLSGSDIVNDKSTIAAGANLIINAVQQSGEIGSGSVGGGNVLNIAWTPLARVQRSRVFEVQQEYLRHDPRRWIPGGWWIYDNQFETVELAVTTGNRPWWMRTDPGVGAAARITAGQAVVIDAHNVSNGAVGTVGGSASVNPGQWNSGAPNAPGLGNRNEVGAVGGGTGPGGVGGLLSPSTGAVTGSGNNTAPPQVIGTPEQPLPNHVPPLGRLFTSNPGSRYLVESDPRFASQSGFLGSDYLLGKLGYSPDGVLKRLGDDFYEQRLVMEQITGLTGRKYLGASTGLDQYRDLMDAGAATAARFNLAVGIALTTQQIAALEQDIVWMVEQEVMGQKVLVPVVYLSQASAQKYRLEGASIAAQDVSINATGSLHNAGTIRAAGDLDLSARNLLNQGELKAGGVAYLAAVDDVVNRNGKISGGQVVISAGRDIVSETRIEGLAGRGASIESAGGLSLDAGRDIGAIGSTLKAGGNAALSAGRDLSLSKSEGLQGTRGTIDVGGNLALSAGRDLSVRQSTATAAGNLVATAGRDLSVVSAAGLTRDQAATASRDDTLVQRGGTQALDAAGLNAGQNLVLQAGQDIKLTAAQLEAGKAIGATAGRDIVSTTVTTTDTAQQQTYAGRTRTTESTRDETLHGTQFKAKGDIALQSGRDIDLTAAAATSDKGAIGLAAGRDVNLRAGQETHTWQQDVSKTKSGTLSTTKTTTHDATQDRNAIGTLLSGDSIAIAAGRDITTQAAQVAATNDVTLAAGRDLTIGTADSTHSEQHDKTSKKTGIYSSGGFNITAGQTKVDQSYSLKQTTPDGSLIGSTQGKVTLTAGNNVRITGSDVLSETGTAIVGKNVTIEAAVGTTETKQTYKQKSAGIHLGLTGGAVSAAEAAYGAVKRGDEVQDDRLKALYAAKAAYAIKDGMGSAQALAEGNKPSDAGISLRIGIGASSASSQTATRDETAYGSRIRSKGDVAIAATDGDLNVIGSQIEGKNVALAATRDINLLSQAEQHRSDSKNKNGSAEVGFSIGSTTGFYVTAQAGRGNAKGNGTSHAETTIKAGDTLSLVSGDNTTIKGAQATADKVLANIGGNLRIESEQDTDDYASKQQQAGGTYVYGSGGSVNFGQQKADGSYRSVNEQSGIAAGQGSFNIAVGGNTHLKGGVIASTADPSKNRLSTGSLTVEDIRNEAEYKASSVGVSAGGGGGGFGVSPNLGLPQSDKSSSTTRSGISVGTLDVRNGDADAVASLDRSVTGLQQTGLKPIFDQRKIEEQIELGQVASEVGFRAVGDLAQSFTRDYDRAKLQQQAAQHVLDDPNATLEERAQAQQAWNNASSVIAAKQGTYDQWKEGSPNKILLHTLVGGLAASLGGGDAVGGLLGAGSAEIVRPLTQGQSESARQIVSLLMGGVGGASGAATGLSGEQFNRMLHTSEQQRIQQLSGGDPRKEVRLTAAACALVRCAAEYPPDSKEYQFYIVLELEGAKPEYAAERALLSQQTERENKRDKFGEVHTLNHQLFDRTAVEAGVDATTSWNSSNGNPIGRIFGGLQAAGGTAAATGGAAACLETFGLGCVLAAWGIDQTQAGARTALTGNATATIGGQLLANLGMSEGAAELLYGLAGAGISAGVGRIAGNGKSATQIAQETRNATSVAGDLPAGYVRGRSAGAAFDETGGLPNGYRRVVHKSTGNVEVLGPDGLIYIEAEAGGLVVKESNLARLVEAEARIAAESKGRLAQGIGILRDAARGKGNFGLGGASRVESDRLGRAWVGEGYKTASDGKTLISADGLRQYRPPSAKPNSPYAVTGVQANFESRLIPEGRWQNNGHLNIGP